MKNISDNFHKHYEKNRIWEKTSWLGVPMWKLPFDAFIIQELIFKIKPDYIIETGTNFGGSTLFYASILELIGHGCVVTIDVEDKIKYNNSTAKRLRENRIVQFLGSSTDPVIYNEVKKLTEYKKNIVLLDSWHSKAHVLQEMKMYSKLLIVGTYMIVEDTHVSGHPIEWAWGEGPYEAVQEFLENNPCFSIDKKCEKLGMTFNPNGYLKKVLHSKKGESHACRK